MLKCLVLFSLGIPELVVNSISKVDIDLRKTLYLDINLAGGTTMLSGFPERLMNEIRKLVAKELKVLLIIIFIKFF